MKISRGHNYFNYHESIKRTELEAIKINIKNSVAKMSEITAL